MYAQHDRKKANEIHPAKAEDIFLDLNKISIH